MGNIFSGPLREQQARIDARQHYKKGWQVNIDNELLPPEYRFAYRQEWNRLESIHDTIPGKEG